MGVPCGAPVATMVAPPVTRCSFESATVLQWSFERTSFGRKRIFEVGGRPRCGGWGIGSRCRRRIVGGFAGCRWRGDWRGRAWRIDSLVGGRPLALALRTVDPGARFLLVDERRNA